MGQQPSLLWVGPRSILFVSFIFFFLPHVHVLPISLYPPVNAPSATDSTRRRPPLPLPLTGEAPPVPSPLIPHRGDTGPRACAVFSTCCSMLWRGSVGKADTWSAARACAGGEIYGGGSCAGGEAGGERRCLGPVGGRRSGQEVGAAPGSQKVV
jgi:hypothetical protein